MRVKPTIVGWLGWLSAGVLTAGLMASLRRSGDDEDRNQQAEETHKEAVPGTSKVSGIHNAGGSKPMGEHIEQPVRGDGPVPPLSPKGNPWTGVAMLVVLVVSVGATLRWFPLDTEVVVVPLLLVGALVGIGALLSLPFRIAPNRGSEVGASLIGGALVAFAVALLGLEAAERQNEQEALTAAEALVNS